MKKRRVMVSIIALVSLIFIGCSENDQKDNVNKDTHEQDLLVKEEKLNLSNYEIYNPMTGEFICNIGDKVSDIQIEVGDNYEDRGSIVSPKGYGGIYLSCEEEYGEEAKVMIMYMNTSNKEVFVSECTVIGAYGVPFFEDTTIYYDDLIDQYGEPSENNIDEFSNEFIVFAENPFNYLGCYIEGDVVTYVERYNLERMYKEYLSDTNPSSYIGMRKMMEIILEQEFELECGENNVEQHKVKTKLGNVDIKPGIVVGALVFDGWMSDELNYNDGSVYSTFELKDEENHCIEVGVNRENHPDYMWIECQISNIRIYGSELYKENKGIEFKCSGLSINSDINNIIRRLGTPSLVRIPYEGQVELQYRGETGEKYRFLCNIFNGSISYISIDF